MGQTLWFCKVYGRSKRSLFNKGDGWRKMGDLVLHVNFLRYRRGEYQDRRREEEEPRNCASYVKFQGKKQIWKEKQQWKSQLWHVKPEEQRKTFAQVPKSGKLGTSTQARKEEMLSEVKEETPLWIKNNSIGFLHKEAKWEDVQEVLFSRGLVGLKAKFMGDDCVLLTPEKELTLEKMVDENRGSLENLFRGVVKWSDKCSPRYKLVWVRCWGLPLSLWNKQVFGKVLEAQAIEVMSID